MYECYSRTDRNPSAYSWAVHSLVGVLFMHMFVFCIMFDLVGYIPYGEKFFIQLGFGIALFIMVVYVSVVILINICFKERDILSIEMDKSSRRIGYVLIVLYFIFTFILLMYQVSIK
jgi:hypothetical protein